MPSPDDAEKKLPFDPEVLDKTVIAKPLLDQIKAERDRIHPVIIDVNLEYQGGRDAARDRVRELAREAIRRTQTDPSQQEINEAKSKLSQQYLFGQFHGAVILEMVRLDGQGETNAARALYHVWPDFPIQGHINKSISTVKADAAARAFSALGAEIIWAVMDSGIDETHKHFERYKNLELPAPLQHRDFTALGQSTERPLADAYGHGTHVAGIIAGFRERSDGEIKAVSRFRDEKGDTKLQTLKLESISGMAPKCKLLSLKVLDDAGNGLASNLIAAIAEIQEINGNGRRIRIHGVNMSVGYGFEPEWFACGQSPLCVEVNRLVRSGVIVVTAAGNTGYSYAQDVFKGMIPAGRPLTINDPGNAELAITVGSTHRDMPHVYGVSYFSSKGPTGDGRLKPDIVAPGEKIISCAAGSLLKEMKDNNVDGEYAEDSGTSMAAPHVSGVIAAFLSVRREFIGEAEAVKKIFLSSATDLNRDRYFQGHGLVDLMRAIQSV